MASGSASVAVASASALGRNSLGLGCPDLVLGRRPPRRSASGSASVGVASASGSDVTALGLGGPDLGPRSRPRSAVASGSASVGVASASGSASSASVPSLGLGRRPPGVASGSASVGVLGFGSTTLGLGCQICLGRGSRRCSGSASVGVGVGFGLGRNSLGLGCPDLVLGRGLLGGGLRLSLGWIPVRRRPSQVRAATASASGAQLRPPVRTVCARRAPALVSLRSFRDTSAARLNGRFGAVQLSVLGRRRSAGSVRLRPARLGLGRARQARRRLRTAIPRRLSLRLVCSAILRPPRRRLSGSATVSTGSPPTASAPAGAPRPAGLLHRHRRDDARTPRTAPRRPRMRTSDARPDTSAAVRPSRRRGGRPPLPRNVRELGTFE